MTRFRYPTPLLLTAVLALFVAIFAFASQGGLFRLVPLAPLVVILFLLRIGTDVNTNGVRVKSLFQNVVVLWPDIAALTADQRGRAVAALTNGGTVALLAVRASDLPRVLSASGKTKADAEHEPK